MLRFTFEDGTTLHIDTTDTVITNKGPLQADQVFVGAYVRCGSAQFCRVDDIVSI